MKTALVLLSLLLGFIFKDIKAFILSRKSTPINIGNVLDAGFELKKSYSHDDWYSNQYEKGELLVEITLETKTDNKTDVSVWVGDLLTEIQTLEELKQLDKLINK